MRYTHDYCQSRRGTNVNQRPCSILSSQMTLHLRRVQEHMLVCMYHMVHPTPSNKPVHFQSIYISIRSIILYTLRLWHFINEGLTINPTKNITTYPAAPCCPTYPNCVRLPPSLGSLRASARSPPVGTTRTATLMSSRGGLFPLN
jgi:hypothetical protein